MAKLARAVFVRDTDTSRDVLLNAGEEPAPKYAVLVKNPACWEGGKLPAVVKRHLADQAKADDTSSEQDGSGNGAEATSGDDSDTSPDADSTESEPEQDTKPATTRATKTAAKKATTPARGRTAAAEGTGGQ